MTRLIALIDHSAYGRSVLDHAGWAALRLGAGVDLLHVLRRRLVEPAEPGGDGGARRTLLEELTEFRGRAADGELAAARALIEDAETRLELKGVAGSRARLAQGDLAEAAAQLEPRAGLLLIGKRGETAEGAAGRIGSNLERVIRSIALPVLVAPRAFRPIASVAVAYDGGPNARRAVARIAESRLFQGLPLRLLTVGGADAADGVEAARARLEAAGYAVETVVEAGQPEEVIARHAAEDGVDLLAMGAYSHSRLRSFIIGSVTTGTLRACRIPVLLFR